MRWSVVVPMKRLALAKTRLHPLSQPARADLALGMAADTVAAALAAVGSGVVLVVTNDAHAAEVLAALGAQLVADQPDAGLNLALRYGASHAVQRRPDWGVAALSADLPALRPNELDSALTAAAGSPRAVVADAAGRGTTLLTARPGEPLAPAYGENSLTHHRGGGAVPLELAHIAGLRHDVDTVADLAAVRRLNVGRHTAVVLARLSAPGPDRAGSGSLDAS